MGCGVHFCKLKCHKDKCVVSKIYLLSDFEMITHPE